MESFFNENKRMGIIIERQTPYEIDRVQEEEVRPYRRERETFHPA